MIIAIDGPAGVGKSTISKMLAEKYRFAYLNTGKVYRAACLWSMQNNAKGKQNEIEATLSLFDGKFSISEDSGQILMDGHDASEKLRDRKVSENVSEFSSHKEIRDILTHFFRREIANSHGKIVLEGRDATTVIAPKADLRILLTASKAARRERRRREGIEDDVSARDEADLKSVDFINPAPGVIEIDTTHMQLEQVFSLLCKMVEKDNLTEEMGEEAEAVQEETGSVINVAIVGRTNVGKSTLANRIFGSKASIVSNSPNVTRDRLRRETEWRGRVLNVTDTAGWTETCEKMDEKMLDQTKFAIRESDVVVFVVDVNSPLTTMDRKIASVLRKASKPVVVAANKADALHGEAQAQEAWKLGLGEPVAISSLHGRNVGDLLDLVVDKGKATSKQRGLRGLPKVAIIGRPNVGKSTLLNKMMGEERALVNDEAGTTRDNIDELVTFQGNSWILTDTAGISRHANLSGGLEYYAFLRAQNAIKRSDVCLLLLDSTHSLSKQDLKVANAAIEAGSGLILVFNKWDAATFEDKERMKSEAEVLPSWAPKVNISALTGWHLHKIAQATDAALKSRRKRIATHQLNQFVSSFQIAHPHPLRSGKQPRILFATQASSVPPQFILFTNFPLDASYVRHLERQIRKEYGFEGSPIAFKQKLKDRSK